MAQNIVNGWSFSATASNTPVINVTNIPSSINNVLVTFSNVSIASGIQFLMLQLSNNNGSSYITSGYLSGQNYAPYNSVTWSNQSLTTGIQLGFQISAGPFSTGNCYLYNLNTSAVVTSTGSTFWTAGSLFGVSGGYLTSGTGMNAFRILMDAGNIGTGIFKIYGLN